MTTEQEKYDQLNEISTNTERLKTYWAKRDQTLKADRDIINLVRPEAKSNESQWIDNEPKVYFNTARSIVSLNPPRFRLPITIGYAPEEKDRMNKAERLCIGAYRAMNMRHRALGGVDWLWDLAYWALLGWVSFTGIVRKNAMGEIEFISDIYDPLTVYPKWDSYGLAICPREYEVDHTEGEAMLEHYTEEGLDFKATLPPVSQGNIKVVNYWKRDFKKGKPQVWNAIVVGGNIVKPMTLQTKLSRIPIHVAAIGSPDMTTAEWMSRKGESIIAANRDVYRYMNAMLQLMAEILAENARPNRVWKLLNPQSNPGELKGYGEDIRIKPQEAVEILKASTTPEETMYLMQHFTKQRQKASLADVTYGTSIADQSGFAISQLLASVKYNLGMYLNTMQRMMGDLFTDFLYQYKKGRFGEITLSTTNPYDIKRGMYYLEDFKTEDVPDHTHVEVQIPISSQFDKTQTIMNTVQALQAGVFSRETAWETQPELGIEDSEQEKERLVEDRVSQDPFIMDMAITERMWAREEYYRTVKGDTIKADALKRYIMLKEMNLGIRQGIPSAPGQSGVPPNQMPPEGRPTGAPSPDQQNAMTGTPPPSPNRPKGVESAGRKGVLVSPQGKPLM